MFIVALSVVITFFVVFITLNIVDRVKSYYAQRKEVQALLKSDVTFLYREAPQRANNNEVNQPASKRPARDIVRIYGEFWFDRATSQCWKRSFFQEFADRSNSILYLTEDKRWIVKQNSWAYTPSEEYIVLSDKDAWQWFLNTRFVNQAPDFLIEKMKDTKR